MKPNRTSMLLRSLFRDLGADYKVDSFGFPKPEALAKYQLPNPLDYSDPRLFAVDYQVYNLARKREDKHPSSSQLRDSLKKWAESEFRCHVVNTHGWWVRPVDPHKRARLDALFQRVRAIISGILLDEWPVLDFHPTGGATATVSRRLAVPPSKVDGTPLTEDPQPHKCTPASRVYLEQMLLNNPGVARRFMRARYKLLGECPDKVEIDGMRLVTDPEWESEVRSLAVHLCSNVPPAAFDYVPKDIKSVRLIAKSNSLSIMVQKTFGDAIRRALLKVGVNLNDQTINQEWARIGSLTGEVATVDLSAASDSISRHCVTLFPRRWQAYFNASRDSEVAVKGKTHKLAMLAGMGNGYIFELESLLFYAMTRAAVEECGLDTSMISVYGDDIICPVGAIELLEEMLLSKGFLLNREKSFWYGKFRESCGKHYFNGCDVTPWYVKSDLDELSELYHHYNGLSEWSNRIGYPLESSLRQIGNCVKQDDRCLVPTTWSTKSGFHYPVEGLKVPAVKWNRAFQRKEVVWSVYVPKPTSCLHERLPDRMQVVNSLIGLESANDICDKHLFVKALLTPRGMGLLRSLHGSTIDYAIPTYGSSFAFRRTKHRGASLDGDA